MQAGAFFSVKSGRKLSGTDRTVRTTVVLHLPRYCHEVVCVHADMCVDLDSLLMNACELDTCCDSRSMRLTHGFQSYSVENGSAC